MIKEVEHKLLTSLIEDVKAMKRASDIEFAAYVQKQIDQGNASTVNETAAYLGRLNAYNDVIELAECMMGCVK